jgi:hypothetical protein
MKTVTYETIRGVGDGSDMHLVKVAPLGGNGLNALDDFKHHIFSLGNATETKNRLRPYTIRTLSTPSSAVVPMEMAVQDELSWPFSHIFAVGEDSVTLAFSERALNYTHELKITTVAANIAALLGAAYQGPEEIQVKTA